MGRDRMDDGAVRRRAWSREFTRRGGASERQRNRLGTFEQQQGHTVWS